MYNIDTCAICRETLETSETRVLPCNHSYHKECIDSWLTRVPSCPYCRTKVVIQGVTPRDSVQRPLPDDDIVPWIRASVDTVTSRDETARFMHVVRHNPNFNRADVLRVIRNFCVWQYFDAHLLPDDDVGPWIYASRYVNIPEPVMGRFMRVLRHGFDIDSVRIVIHHAYLFQPVNHSEPGYSDTLDQLIQREHTVVGRPPNNPYNLQAYDEWVDVAMHLLPDDDVGPWMQASRFGDVSEPDMDRFVRVLRHGFNRDDVFEVIHSFWWHQTGYSDDFEELLVQVLMSLSLPQ